MDSYTIKLTATGKDGVITRLPEPWGSNRNPRLQKEEYTSKVVVVPSGSTFCWENHVPEGVSGLVRNDYLDLFVVCVEGVVRTNKEFPTTAGEIARLLEEDL